jgi:oxygen-independent coproporphyrinogen-3 oxidase
VFESIDTTFLKKYDRPGPRYTSYPTAPLFHSSFGPADYLEALRDTNGNDAHSEISLYFHFPFCDTLCYFCGCTMQVTRDRKRVTEYLQYLRKEIDMVAAVVAPGRNVTQLHWGGGTPTHLTPEDILDIAQYTLRAFHLSSDAEVSVEIDPRELAQRHLGTLRHVGFNRVSIGVQDFDEKVQRAVNRFQPKDLTLKVFKWIEALGFESINVDLIYGLPFQTVRSFEQTLRETARLRPNRIAVFNYAHVPWLKPHQKLIHQEDLPTAEEKLSILEMTIRLLTDEGYEYIGMDHFARPDDELAIAQRQKTLYRNFQGYSTRAGADLYGLGMSSISHFGDVYAQNAKTLAEYYAALDGGHLATHSGYRMNRDDMIRKYVIMRLMCDLELDKKRTGQRFGITFDEYFAPSLDRLRPFIDDGIIEHTQDAILIRETGRLVLRNIAMCFDAYVDTMGAARPLFSRTV